MGVHLKRRIGTDHAGGIEGREMLWTSMEGSVLGGARGKAVDSPVHSMSVTGPSTNHHESHKALSSGERRVSRPSFQSLYEVKKTSRRETKGGNG